MVVAQKQRPKPREARKVLELFDLVVREVNAIHLVVARSEILHRRDLVAAQQKLALANAVDPNLGASDEFFSLKVLITSFS